MHKDKEENGLLSHMHHHDTYRSRELSAIEHSLADGDTFLQVNTTENTKTPNDHKISC